MSVDARQGFHQILVRDCDQEKLAFFAPDGKKYTFVVMPFGPMNGPATYTAMMTKLKDVWDLMYEDLKDVPIAWGTRIIIDDILLYSVDPEKLLSHFECVCRVFQKYRVSFP
ncbi:MAG: reverse transcriptase domain-containing protein [Gloeomargaritales cyanobacterium]